MHRINIVRTVPRWKSPFVPYVFFLFSSFWPPRAITRPINLISSPWEAPPRCQKSYFPASLSLSLSLLLFFDVLFFFFLSLFLSFNPFAPRFVSTGNAFDGPLYSREGLVLSIFFLFCFVVAVFYVSLFPSVEAVRFSRPGVHDEFSSYVNRQGLSSWRGGPRRVREKLFGTDLVVRGGRVLFPFEKRLKMLSKKYFSFFLIFKIYIFHD